jgi:Trk K+ transport system NAD-binding subunit
MTAKEKLREQVEALSEEEAQETLRLLELRRDPVVVAFRDAPLDDEPVTPGEEEALAEADRDIAAGRTISLEELKRELGDE